MNLLRGMLPAWEVESHWYAAYGAYWVAIWPKNLKGAQCHEGRAETLELAVLAAVLRALAAAQAS